MLLAVGVHFSPLMFAALAAWILCTTLHEFAHALVAYWGGDDTVRGKGYLSLDPTRFIDPIFTLLIPAIVLLMGGFPLPGAAVMIDTSRLRSARWSAYVSAAGPASNLILFLLFALPLHPLVGLVDPEAPFQPTWVNFIGAMAVLNFLGVLFNLIPVPPLDGFGIIEHRFDYDLRWKLRQPQVAMACLAVVFILLWTVPRASMPFFWMLDQVCGALGLPLEVLLRGYYVVMFDQEL
jgi:Zn-dependent protease